MKKDKKFKVGILIIDLFFTLLYFSIHFGGINLSINDEGSGNKNIRPILSNGKSCSFEWSRTWGGADWDFAMGVAVNSLDNVYVAGWTKSFGLGSYDMVLVKYDGNGTQQWSRIWGGANSDFTTGVAIDSSDNLYLAGHTDSYGAGMCDMVLVKYDGDGVQQWNCTWGELDGDDCNGVAVDSSDNVYIAGCTYNSEAGNTNIVLVKYDGNGMQQWNRTWGGDDYDDGYGVAVDSSGNVYVAGYTRSFGAGDWEMVLVKYDENGVQQWNCTWGGGNGDGGEGVAVDSSDNVYLAGITYSFGAGGGDMILVKYNGNGTQQWNRTWGGDDYDHGYGVAIDSSDNVYLTGRTESFGAGDADMVLVKYDRNGTQQGSYTWGGIDRDFAMEVVVNSLDNVYLVGGTGSFGAGSYDMILIKYSNVEQLSSDGVIMNLIIVVSIASVVGVSNVIIYFIRKRGKVVD